MKRKHSHFKRFHVLYLNDEDAQNIKYAMEFYMVYYYPVYAYHKNIKRKPSQERANEFYVKLRACKRLINYLDATHDFFKP